MTDDDAIRKLMRRAYATTAVPPEQGLDDVVRRASRSEPRRPKRRVLAVVGTFAAAIVTILAVAVALAGRDGSSPAQEPFPPGDVPPVNLATGGPVSRGPGNTAPPTSLPPVVTSYPPSPQSSQFAAPNPLPSACTSAWTLTRSGTQFAVGVRPGFQCPAVDPRRLYLMDHAKPAGDQRERGTAKLYYLMTEFSGPVTAPFSFAPFAWPGHTAGHVYQLLFLPVPAAPYPGEDAWLFYNTAVYLTPVTVR